jgi:rhodanese-related sulfurtransferase
MSTTRKKALVLNVLDAKYARDCMIKGTHSVPLSMLGNFVKEMPRSTELIVYCARYGCPVSEQAYHLLVGLGFTAVRAYEGGIKEWHQKGLPTEGACSMEYLRGPAEKPSEHKKEVRTITLDELQRELGY